jgi:hypothetical protein
MARASKTTALTWEAVRRAALALPDVEEGTAYSFPAFRHNGNLFLCYRQDLGAIGVYSTFEQRDAMIAEDPETYFTTDHHRPYPWVLARLKSLHASALPDLLQMGLRCAPQRKQKRKIKRG